MRNYLAAVLSAALNFSSTGLVAGQQATTPPVAGAHGAASDSHEGMTITVEPWAHAANYKEKFPKKSPYTGGVVALHVTFRNDTDESMKVDLPRIRLMLTLDEDNRQELDSLSADDVADAVLLKGTKDPTKRRNPLPMPVGKPNLSRDKNWTDFKNDCQNAAIPSPVVAARSSMDGLVYFDIRGEWDLLQKAKLYVPGIVSMSSHTPLSYFEIDLSNTH
jgi:hypothetical protein